jgi:hypothetical protein
MTVRSSLILATLLAVALFGTADCQSATVTQRTEKRILDCTLESQSLDDCNLMNYAIRVAVFSVPGLIIAIFFLLICPFYCCCKYCCNCCGGRNQTPNFCCPNTELPARYSRGDILRPKVFAVICLLAMLAAVTWGLVGVDRFYTGVFDILANIQLVPDRMLQQITDIRDALYVEKYDPVTKNVTNTSLLGTPGAGADTYNQAVDSKNNISATINDALGPVTDYIKKSIPGLWLAFLIPGFLIFLGSIAALANCRRFFPMTMVWFLFLFGFIIWIAHSVFSATSMVLGDFCAEVHGLALKQLNLISILSSCQDSQFSSFKSTFRSLEIDQAESTCRDIAAHCFDATQSVASNVASQLVYNCPTSLTCTGMTFATLVGLMETVFYIHPSIASDSTAQSLGYVCVDPSYSNSCTMNRCGDETIGCVTSPGTLSDIGEYSEGVYINFLAAKKVSNVIDTLGARFSTCDSVMSLLISPFDGPCQAITSGLVNARQASGLLGLACIAGIFIFAWGAKRFIPLDQADLAQGDGVTPVEELQG